MNDKNTATIRTTVNSAWVSAVAVLLTNLFGWEIDLNDPVVILVLPAVGVVVYRISVVLSEKIPWIGYILYGVNRSPGYAGPPPDVPVVAEPPPVDRGDISNNMLWTVALILGIIILAVVLVRMIT